MGDCAIPPEASADDRRQEGPGTRRKSVSTYRQALLEDPKDVATRHELALILHSASDHFAALRELDYCLGLSPDDPDVLRSRGLVNVSVGDFEAAEGDLRRAAESGGGSAEAESYLGVLLSRRGLWRHAVPHFRRSIELERQQAAAYQRKTGCGSAPAPVTLLRRSTACTCPWRSETLRCEE